ncbi:MAG: zinc-binding dehydrogenase [Propionibacteriaceae bacterium]|nr:zinc-binding dehydrogenase [Propionibacteriaceae bacterium]
MKDSTEVAPDMRVGVYYAPDDIRIERRRVPDIADDEMLVRVDATALCAGEAMEWYSTKEGGKILGHEPVGTVAKVGAQVTDYVPGDRVFVNHHVGRMSSHWSIRGHETMDPFYKQNRLYPGAMADYFRVSANHLRADVHLVPKSIGDDVATTIEPWSCVLAGLKVCGIQPGDTVLVIGAGFMGMGFIHMAHLFGAGRVIASDFSEWRRNKALELGATDTLDPAQDDQAGRLRAINGGLLADVVVTTAPTVAAWQTAVELVEKGGTIHLGAPGRPGSQWVLDAADQYFSEVTVTSKYSADHRSTYQYIRLLGSGQVNPRPAITHHFSLDELPGAFKLLQAQGESLKIILYPDGTPDKKGNSK